MTVLIVHCILWLIVPFRAILDVRSLGPRHNCKQCEYDLSGLPEDALCPECGAAQGIRIITVTHTRIRFCPERLVLLAFTLPATIAYAAFGLTIAERLATYSYQLSGYSRQVAAAAAQHRDLVNGEYWSVLLPIGPFLALCPLLAILPRPRWSVIVFLAAFSAAALTAIGVWTVPYVR